MGFALSIDPMTWYQLSETRAVFDSVLQSNETSVFFGQPNITQPELWQIFDIGDDEYVLRNKASGISEQLSTCYVADEVDPSKTQPCMRPSTGENSQKWNVVPWGDESFKFINVANGTKYLMDCHPGEPVYMSSNLDPAIRDPAQRWLLSSYSEIDDGAFSTTITYLPNSATAPASTSASTTGSGSSSKATGGPLSSSNSSSSGKGHSGLSTGAAVGIGVAVTLLFCIAMVAAAYFFLRKRRRPGPGPDTDTDTPPELEAASVSKYKLADSNSRYEMGRDTEKFEMAGPVPTHELPHDHVAVAPVELSAAPPHQQQREVALEPSSNAENETEHEPSSKTDDGLEQDPPSKSGSDL